ncbi:hypothetical protein [Candidatus Nitrospira bockiana]
MPLTAIEPVPSRQARPPSPMPATEQPAEDVLAGATGIINGLFLGLLLWLALLIPVLLYWLW